MATNTTATSQTHNGNGSTASFAISFSFLDNTEVDVRVGGVLKTITTHYTISGSTVTFTSGNIPPSGTANISFTRDTNISNKKVDFADGSVLTETDLDNNSDQILFAQQEIIEDYVKRDGSQTITGNLVFEGATDDGNETTLAITDPTADRTITVPDRSGTLITSGDTGTVNSTMIADGTIVNGDIANTTITGGKLVNDTITSTQIGANAVTASELADNAVDTNAVQDDAITYSKIQNVSATDRILGRDSSGAGVIEEITPANVRTMINVEDGATADQSNAEIRTAVEAASDSNVFTDADHTKLNGIEASADVTDATNVDAAGAVMNSDTSTAAMQFVVDEDNFSSDSNTKVPTQQSSKAYIATVAATKQPVDSELTTLSGMQSATASKLADSTALTSDIADLNQIDGLTKQTTISDSDASFPTSGAVVDYVAAQIAPIGGLEVIANEDSFPTSQPSSGVVISISDIEGLITNGSGVATNARTTGNGSDNVTINGFPSSLYSKTMAAGLGLMVSSTGSSQTYTYHKLLAKEADVEQLSNDINDFAARYRVGSSNPSSDLDAGDLFFNTSTQKLLVYNSTNSAWEEAQSIGNFFISTFSESFDGSRTDFTVSNAPANAQQILLSINGVVQKPNSGTSTPSEGFALSGSTVKLSSAPASGSDVFIIVMGSTVNIGTPSNNTVTSAILQNGSVITAKLADQAVTLDKLLHGDSNSNGKFLRANNGADPTFESVITDLVNDTSPQLGGNLDVNTKNIVFGDSAGTTDDRLVFGAGSDLFIYHDGSHSRINGSGTGKLILMGSEINLNNSDSSEYCLRTLENGAVELYHDNARRLYTRSNGITVQGNGSAVTIDLSTDTTYRGSIYADPNNGINFLNSSTSFSFRVQNDGVAVFYGHALPQANNTYDLGSTSLRWRNVYTNDLNLSNEGSSNDVDGTWGNWTIQEGESDLFLKNNRSGKKYKFNLTEVN